jgi:hypothetical protein
MRISSEIESADVTTYQLSIVNYLLIRTFVG